MGADRYSFTCVKLGGGILVALRDVLANLQQDRSTVEKALEDGTIFIPPEFTILCICNRFLLFSPFGDESQVVGSTLNVLGPNCGDDSGKISVEPFPPSTPSKASLRAKLLRVAHEVTGSDTLKFAPGVYTLLHSRDREVEMYVLRGPDEDTLAFTGEIWQLDNRIPRDVTFRRTDTGEEMSSNTSILKFYGLEQSFVSMAHTTKEGEKEILVDAKDIHTLEQGYLKECMEKNCSKDIAAFSDCVFHVGEEKDEIHVNRAVLAVQNKILCNILYGTESMPVDPNDFTKPIGLPNFDKTAVELVFQALMLRHVGNLKVAKENEVDVLDVLDYIDQDPAQLQIVFPSLIGAENEAEWYWNGDDGDGDDPWQLADDDCSSPDPYPTPLETESDLEDERYLMELVATETNEHDSEEDHSATEKMDTAA
jgi:hypothetical protein